MRMEKKANGRLQLEVLQSGERSSQEGQVFFIDADNLVSCCGYRPNDSFWAQLQVLCFRKLPPLRPLGILFFVLLFEHRSMLSLCLSAVQVHQCYASFAPMKLAAGTHHA